MRTLFILALLGAAAPAFADSVLDLRASFPEVKPYSGPISPAVTGAFAFPGQGRFRITATYSPWSRLTNEMFKWRSTVPIDGRDFGAWVEFVPGATLVSSRGDPEPRVDGGGLVIVYEITVRQAQPGMQAAITPPVVRFGDGSFHQLPASASVVIESLSNDSGNSATPSSLPQATNMNVSGDWTVTFSGKDSMSLRLQQSGTTVTGTLAASDNSKPYVTGRMEGRTLTLSRETGLETIQNYQVTVDGNRFSGTFWNVGKYPDQGSFTGER